MERDSLYSTELEDFPPERGWITSEPAKVTERCTMTVSYAKERPEVPSLRFNGDECAMNAEIALAFALAAFLKMSGAAVPR